MICIQVDLLPKFLESPDDVWSWSGAQIFDICRVQAIVNAAAGEGEKGLGDG
jgi:hypothetical protein